MIVVDDDPMMVQLLERIMTKLGWRIRAFTYAPDALESALADVPTLVVTDWAMPRLDGIALAAALRERLGSHVPKLVLITAAREAVAQRDGAFDLVVGKPFRVMEFMEDLRALCEDVPSSHTRLTRPRRVDEGSDDEQQSGT